ncbi:NTP transferase domain-containing protein, partial [Mycolicibacter algericus]
LGLRAAARAGAERAFVCAVDMPFLVPALIGLLADAHPGADVVLPRAGRDHYLAAVYRTALAGSIDALVADGQRRVGALVDMVEAQRVELEDPAPLANLNSPDDIAGLC